MKHAPQASMFVLAVSMSGHVAALEGPPISGQLEYDGVMYREPTPREDYAKQFTLDLEASQPLGEDSRLFLNQRLRDDVESDERDHYRLREAYLDSRFEAF